MEEFSRSPEWKAYWSAARASMDGDDAPIRGWAEERIGHKPDSVLRVHLRKDVLADASPAETWAVVDTRGARRRREAKARDINRRAPEIRQNIKIYPPLLEALRFLASGDQTPEQVLLERIVSEGYEAVLHVTDTDMPGVIANQIRRGAIESADDRKTVRELAEFAVREITLKRARDAGLPPREYELYKFFVDNPGSTNAQAAQSLGIAVGTVKSLKHRIKNTAEIA
jgi:DNA-binding CsgD family transcriptional regulator